MAKDIARFIRSDIDRPMGNKIHQKRPPCRKGWPACKRARTVRGIVYFALAAPDVASLAFATPICPALRMPGPRHDPLKNQFGIALSDP
jgi:hypothetical protein